MEEFVFFDVQVSKGTENLYELVTAIKKNIVIHFDHHKDFEEVASRREIRPLALKEVKNSWYLIGLNEKRELRNYGLDRMENLKLSKQPFKKPKGLDLRTHYKHVFGIFNNPNSKVERILLHFEPQRGHFLKAKPLHPSQKVLEDTEKGLTISIEVKINNELISELLSFSNQISIIRPEKLKLEFQGLLKLMLERTK